MGRREHQMIGICDALLFGPGIGSPQQKHHGLLPLIEQIDDPIGEILPSHAPVGIGCMGPDGEHRVQQQHPSLGPLGQAAVTGTMKSHIIFQFLINIIEGRGHRHPFLHRKAEPMGLAGAMVGVLAQNHRPHLMVGRIFQGIENIVHRGINGAAAVLRRQEFAQLLVIFLVKFPFQQLVPVISDMNHILRPFPK